MTYQFTTSCYAKPKYHLFILVIFLLTSSTYAQNSKGTIRNNTNAALPASYNFREYVFAEPNDQGTCTGASNASATIREVFLSQTHRHAVGHPFFFTIGHRPALLQLAVTGSGTAPDVTVRGTLNGNSLGTLCLKGPANLPASVNLNVPDFNNYFSVTLPKSWVQDGLTLVVTAGNSSRTITPQELKIGPYKELNLVMVNMNVMDYTTGPHLYPIFDDFLQELASSMPASVVRFGVFPEMLNFPEAIASKNVEQLVRLKSKGEVSADPVMDDGFINSIATQFLGELHKSTQDYLSTIYFGNTLNLAPGGWGGGRSFVSFDYTDVFIHELGHALSLPHWGDDYNRANPQSYQYNYPYGGETGNGGGRGNTWNFIQDTYEFVNPICQSGTNGTAGQERSDCMQRNHACLETRTNDNGPWDGHGDFSAIAMHRFMVGAPVQSGQVFDRGALRNYQLSAQSGFPTMTLSNNKRTYTRFPQQPQATIYEEQFDMPGEEKLNTNVHLIYGTAHPTQPQANIVYCPVSYNGTLPPIVDPTNPTTFNQLKSDPYRQFLYFPKDLTLKVTYTDGSVLHALNPYQTFDRPPYTGDFGIWRRDLINFSLLVPGDKDIQKVEVFNRPFAVRGTNDPFPGNINYAGHGITAATYMNGATKLSEYNVNQAKVPGPNAIGNRVWHDLNRDGINDPHEPGIAGVSVLLWGDSNGDGIPDDRGLLGVTKTDQNGYYRFGVGPGKYTVFVWQVDNWDNGEPLDGYISTNGFVANADNDVDLDNNGSGNPFTDIMSGIITITPTGEPLNDGDGTDCWFDYDASGNMTIDFGFYAPNGLPGFGDGQCGTGNNFVIQDADISNTKNVFNTNGTIATHGSVAINSVDGDVVFKSATTIDLKVGFEVKVGGSFLADIEPCTANLQAEPPMVYTKIAPSRSETDLTIIPNPTIDQTQFQFWMEAEGDVSLRIFDFSGQQVSQVLPPQQMDKGMHQIAYNVDQLSAGMFYVVLQVGQTTTTEKMVILR